MALDDGIQIAILVLVIFIFILIINNTSVLYVQTASADEKDVSFEDCKSQYHCVQKRHTPPTSRRRTGFQSEQDMSKYQESKKTNKALSF